MLCLKSYLSLPQAIHHTRHHYCVLTDIGHLGSARLHISGRALDAAFLSGLSAFAVTDFFGFQAQEDAELQPGIYISRPVRAPILVPSIPSESHATYYPSSASV